MAYDLSDQDLARYLKENERPRVDMRKQKSRGRPDPRGIDVGRRAVEGSGIIGGVQTAGIIESLQQRGAILAWYSVDSLAALADGASITSWPDLSGNGQTLLPDSVSPINPVYRQSGPGDGLPSAFFDATILARLKGPNSILLVGPKTSFSLLFVVRLPVGSTTGSVIWESNSTPRASSQVVSSSLSDSITQWKRFLQVGLISDGSHFLIGGGSYSLAEAGPPADSWEVHTAHYSGSATASGITALHGRGYLPATTPIISQLTPLGAMMPGNPFWLGSQLAGQAFWFRELILCVPALSSTDEQALQQFLGLKWRTS